MACHVNLLFMSNDEKAQIFMPIISYYNSFTYHYGMQNWCCTQDDRGIMYFANNNGVLSFDGYSWRTIALPSKGLVRSILADGDRIYVGSYTDFGYFVRDEWGKMVYHSLWPKKYQSHNDEIWNIVKGADGHIYFQSFCSYFVYDGKVKAWGNIRLRVSFPNYDNDKLLFCYTLKGGGNTLTESSYSPEIVYSNFGFGDYELTVVVKNLKGDIIGKPLVYCFSFPAPFLLSWWAWLMYLLLLSALVYGYIRWRTNKIIRRNKKIAEKELLEQKMKSLEQERIIAEQQKQLLENELALKGKDVASMAFDMVAMNNSISEAKETLLEGMRKGTITTKNASKLLLQMKSGDNDLFWNTFQNNFDLIHKKFFRSLREKYPDLTSNDLKVCALLRLNLNTKDIANFTHLTIRGVEGARYRLRKKLGIPTDKSLTDFLIEFE